MKFIISVHSFIDVITNSSTELFVFNKEEYSIELLEDILKDLNAVSKKANTREFNMDEIKIYTESAKYLKKVFKDYDMNFKQESEDGFFIVVEDYNDFPCHVRDFLEDISLCKVHCG